MLSLRCTTRPTTLSDVVVGLCQRPTDVAIYPCPTVTTSGTAKTATLQPDRRRGDFVVCWVAGLRASASQASIQQLVVRQNGQLLIDASLAGSGDGTYLARLANGLGFPIPGSLQTTYPVGPGFNCDLPAPFVVAPGSSLEFSVDGQGPADGNTVVAFGYHVDPRDAHAIVAELGTPWARTATAATRILTDRPTRLRRAQWMMAATAHTSYALIAGDRFAWPLGLTTDGATNPQCLWDVDGWDLPGQTEIAVQQQAGSATFIDRLTLWGTT